MGVKQSTLEREAYFLDYAEKVRARCRVPLVVTGGFRSGPAMRSALESGATDMIGMARPLAVCPDFPKRLLENPDSAITLKRPSTGSSFLNRMTMLDVTWYEAQLSRMAEGKAPRPELGAWPAVFQMLSRAGAPAFAPRRA